MSGARLRFSERHKGRGTIMVIDDDPVCIVSMPGVLTQRGYHVTVTVDGAAALRQIALETPALILLGTSAGELSGVDVCRQLLLIEQCRTMPIIFLVPPGHAEEYRSVLALGVVDCITKPVDMVILVRLVEHLLQSCMLPSPRRHRWRLALRSGAMVHQRIFDHLSDAVLAMAEPGQFRFVRVNTAFAELVGISASMIVGKLPEDVFGVKTGAHLRAACHRCVEVVDEIAFTWEAGHSVLKLTLLDDKVRESAEKCLIGISVARPPVFEAEVHRVSLIGRDSLTGLYNAHGFRSQLMLAMTSADARGDSLGLLLLDLDNFRDINHTVGRSQADSLLKACARRLELLVGHDGIVARSGGNEFSILVAADQDGANLAKLARRLLRLLARPSSLNGVALSTSGSMGLAMYPRDGRSTDDLLVNADVAMYRAKSEGKNRFHAFSAALGSATRRRLAISTALRSALCNKEFTLHYQPRFARDGALIAGVEALIRWNNSKLGAVTPDEFIPTAEQSGLILPIGAWVLHEACRQAKAWSEQLPVAVPVAVNLSVRQFREGDLVRTVNSALAASGLPPYLLELELTESMLMFSTRQRRRTLDELKAIGVSLAVDDFGTGYSSLSYLKTFPLDLLKIDRSFICGLPEDGRDRAIVRAIIVMAHSLDLRVVAEGVETMKQAQMLWELGCDEIQGYYYSRPLDPAAMYDFMQLHATRPVL